ncbi:MAG: hypothetical protein BWZ06_01867 [Bacteroidetes bacterium ADurb.BinA261]|nr:MAG: hypothetical protein BWZ06_01867 [Bacteroidetes bacterium ADurb.BinA261]
MNQFDMGSHESYIFQILANGLCCTAPHARTFDIDSDKIFLGEKFGQFHRIFAFATTQFQNNGVFVPKIFLIPFPFQRKDFAFEFFERILKHVAVRGHFGKLCQFIFPHVGFSLSINTKLRNYRVSEKLRTICLLLLFCKS